MQEKTPLQNPGKPQRWGNYFKEFTMLFLAVFLGFLAENYREYLDERSIEKAYIKNYIEDLKADTAALKKNLRFRIKKISQLDSLMDLLQFSNTEGHEKDLYYYGRKLLRAENFQSNDRTITQLRQSGGMKVIQNIQASDSIMSYQKLVEIILGNQTDERKERMDAFPAICRLFNPFVLDEMVSIEGVKKPHANPELRSNDPEVRQDLAHHVHMIKGSYYLMENRLQLLILKAERTIKFLEKEYQLN